MAVLLSRPPPAAYGCQMTRYEAALEAAVLVGEIRGSEEPANVANGALSRLLGTGLLNAEEVAEIEAFVAVTQRMNSRDFAKDMAESFLDLIKKLEPSAAILQ